MDVFVCGTLTDPDRAGALLDDWRFLGDAVLCGLHRVDGAYPTLAPGGLVDGRLLRTAEVDRLDAYEGVDAGLYVRVSVLRSDADATVAVYVGNSDRLDAAASWPVEGPFAERVRHYLEDHEVVVCEADDRQD